MHAESTTPTASSPELLALHRPSAARWLLGAAGDWVVIIAAMALARLINHPLSYVAAVLIIGTRQHAFMILVHDAAHRMISRKRWLNDLLGDLLCGWWVSQTTRGFRKWHLEHHRLNGTPADPENDVKALSGSYWDLPSSRRALAAGLAIDLAGLGTLRVLRFWLKYPAVNVLDGLGTLVVPALFVTTCVALGQWWIPALWIGAMFTSFPAAFRLRMWTEHVGTDDTLRVTVPWWQRLLFAPHNTWYHWEHHQWPFVPFWNLPRARALQGPLPAIVPFSEVLDGLSAGQAAAQTVTVSHQRPA